MSQQNKKTEEKLNDIQEQEELESEEEKAGPEERRKFSKNARLFIDYINHDWEDDQAWKAFENSNPDIMKEPRDKEEAKREFYKQHTNARFDTKFTIKDDEERARFIQFVKYNNTLRNLQAIHEKQSDVARLVCNLKHIFFALFLVTFPLKNWRPAAVCYTSAHLASLVHMYITLKPKKDPFSTRLFSEEELLTFFCYAAIVVSGPFVRVLLYVQLLIWASVSTCEWLDHILEKRPNFPILCALTPFLDIVRDSWIEIIMVKNHTEIFTMMLSCVGWVFGLNAPLLPVAYTQFVRIKAISSHFTGHSFAALRETLEKHLPENIYLAFVNPVVGFLRNMDATTKKAQEDAVQRKGRAAENVKSAKKAPAKKSNKLRPVASDSDDEPKTYEIVDDDVPEAVYEDLD